MTGSHLPQSDDFEMRDLPPVWPCPWCGAMLDPTGADHLCEAAADGGTALFFNETLGKTVEVYVRSGPVHILMGEAFLEALDETGAGWVRDVIEGDDEAET